MTTSVNGHLTSMRSSRTCDSLNSRWFWTKSTTTLSFRKRCLLAPHSSSATLMTHLSWPLKRMARISRSASTCESSQSKSLRRSPWELPVRILTWSHTCHPLSAESSSHSTPSRCLLNLWVLSSSLKSMASFAYSSAARSSSWCSPCCSQTSPQLLLWRRLASCERDSDLTP